MLANKLYIPTKKEAPADAEVVSQKLMLRAGLISRVASGIYNWLPLGMRTLKKLESIIRHEMNQAGSLEILMPTVQPSDLWKESGRHHTFGKELLEFQDRHNRHFILGPTHEEVITDLFRKELSTYKQLPQSFFQIQTKFRDEIRPRFGVMRGREFIMKDAYSFHTSSEDLDREYQVMYDTYTRIFKQIGLEFLPVEADSGAIGGSCTHEFHVLANAGEDVIVYDEGKNYIANLETAEGMPKYIENTNQNYTKKQETSTPNQNTCEQVSQYLNIHLSHIVKSIVIQRQDKPEKLTLVLLRGDDALNELKAQKFLGQFRFANEKEIKYCFKSPPGYLGPVNIDHDKIEVLADKAVLDLKNFVCGANKEGYHFTGLNWEKDLPIPTVSDFRNVKEGDWTNGKKSTLKTCRGIEVGQVFKLGRKYSEVLDCAFTDENGRKKFPEMGCYGIGVTRTVAATIEQNHDESGIIWPVSIAPFELVIIPMSVSENTLEQAKKLYKDAISQNIDVILDDRNIRPGVKIKDWDLIGIPYRITLGDKSLQNKEAEWQKRGTTEKLFLPIAQVIDHTCQAIQIEKDNI